VLRSLLTPLLLFCLAVLPLTGCGVSYDCSRSAFITGQPAAQTVAAGDRALFTVAASSSEPLSYQWLKNGVAIAGATQAAYITPVTTVADSGASFTVTASSPMGSLTSNVATLTVSPSTQQTRYVATDGDDSGSGTIDKPFRTIQHCATTVSAGMVCAIRQGTYRETITPNSGVTITAYDLEPVVVDGSDPVTGWVRYQDSIYSASVHMSDDDSNQVFVGDQMMTEARWPNGDDLFDVNWARVASGTNTGQIIDPKMPIVDWTGAKVHFWSGSNPFGHETGNITGSAPGVLKIDIGQASSWCPSICPTSGGYYYLFGTLSALDAEREWFYDSATSTLYFKAPGGVDPNTIDVRAKQRQLAFDLRGRSNVTVRDIAIFASTILTDQSSANNTVDRINVRYPSHFTTLPADYPTGILFVHLSDSGIVLDGIGNILQNSTISYSAGNGVAVQGTNNIVRNNLIHHVDYMGDYTSGIVLNADNNIIQFNTVHDVGRQALFFNSVVAQDVGSNNLFRSMLLTRDGAEIYACCGQVASGTRIHHNWIHDTRSMVEGPGDGGSLSGVYIDNGSTGFNVDQNVLWSNKYYNVFVNGYSLGGPNNNNIQNNTIPDDSSEGNILLANVQDCSATRVVDNKVVVKIRKKNSGKICSISNNKSSAPGAFEMSDSTSVGCNFDGCASAMPPTVLDGGSVAPCPVAVPSKP
jgi:hypothetical protein